MQKVSKQERYKKFQKLHRASFDLHNGEKEPFLHRNFTTLLQAQNAIQSQNWKYKALPIDSGLDMKTYYFYISALEVKVSMMIREGGKKGSAHYWICRVFILRNHVAVVFCFVKASGQM